MQLSLVAGLVNQVLCRVETDGLRNTDPAPDQEANGQGNVMMLDAEVLEHTHPHHCVHTIPLTSVQE